MKICSLNALVFMMMFINVTANGQEDTNNSDEIPSMELLEFLADWEDEQGEWQDPEDFMDDSFVSLNEERQESYE